MEGDILEERGLSGLPFMVNLKAVHAYTHGSIQISKYPVLHYFVIDRDVNVLCDQYNKRSTERFE